MRVYSDTGSNYSSCYPKIWNICVAHKSASIWSLVLRREHFSCFNINCWSLFCLQWTQYATLSRWEVNEWVSAYLNACSMSRTKRYFTSDFNVRSNAVLIESAVAGIFSISDVMLCLPQKSSISCVSFMPPIRLPVTTGRLKSRAMALISSGFGGAPTLEIYKILEWAEKHITLRTCRWCLQSQVDRSLRRHRGKQRPCRWWNRRSSLLLSVGSHLSRRWMLSHLVSRHRFASIPTWRWLWRARPLQRRTSQPCGQDHRDRLLCKRMAKVMHGQTHQRDIPDARIFSDLVFAQGWIGSNASTEQRRCSVQG